MSYMADNGHLFYKVGNPFSTYNDEYYRNLHRELFNVWLFLAQEGMLEEAREYMEEHRGDPTPFETILLDGAELVKPY